MADSQGNADLKRIYKAWLREHVDRQPRGLHARLAKRFGTNKSFISQVLNPESPTSLPPRHLPALLETCEFTHDERDKFLSLYSRAHGLGPSEVATLSGSGNNRIEIALPDFRDAAIQNHVEKSIRSNAESIIALARLADRAGN
ncbi:MAG: hypothetical protein OXI87_05320 [Albidovulum sp.]|nr:hypothetical protein [Albidovulum sp.]MDE0531577.1 hypothetical protein [Albidovulum sp.]